MIRMFVVFVFVFAAVWLSVITWRQMTGKEKWQLVKTLTFSGFCAMITTDILMIIVLVF